MLTWLLDCLHFVRFAAYKAVTSDDSADGKLFIICRHTYSTTATATDGDVDTAVLGKRKERDKTEENGECIR